MQSWSIAAIIILCVRGISIPLSKFNQECPKLDKLEFPDSKLNDISTAFNQFFLDSKLNGISTPFNQSFPDSKSRIISSLFNQLLPNSKLDDFSTAQRLKISKHVLSRRDVREDGNIRYHLYLNLFISLAQLYLIVGSGCSLEQRLSHLSIWLMNLASLIERMRQIRRARMEVGWRRRRLGDDEDEAVPGLVLEELLDDQDGQHGF